MAFLLLTFSFALIVFDFSYGVKDDPTQPPEEICNAFNKLRSDMVLMCEVSTALSACIYKTESFKYK